MKRIIPFIFLLMIGSGCVAQSDKYQRAPIPTARPTSEVDIGDGGLVSQDPCGPPCLLGITPGQSSFEDVEKQLDQYGLSAVCEDEGGQWSCRELLMPVQIYMNFEHAKVQFIIIRTSDITLGQIVDTYGIPDMWVVYQDVDGDIISPYYSLELCFDEISTIVRLEEIDNGAIYSVQPATFVYEVTYFSGGCGSYYPPFETKPWMGYGEYSPDIP